MRRARPFPPSIATGTLDHPVASEAQHFFRCPTCGHMIDMRNLGEVMEHSGAPHAAPAKN